MFVYLVAAACGPGKGTSSTDTATTTASTSASASDSSGGSTSATASTTDSMTSQPTSTTGPALGCNGVDVATCSESSPLNEENFCVWVDVYTAMISGTICRTALARSTCMEANANEGGPGCSGFFNKKGEQGGVELLVGTGCGDPVSEPAWAFCFSDGVTPAIPECACIGESYCADQIDEVNCVNATHDLRACTWEQPMCVPA